MWFVLPVLRQVCQLSYTFRESRLCLRFLADSGPVEVGDLTGHMVDRL